MLPIHRRARFAARALVVPVALGMLAAGAPLAAAHTDLDGRSPAAKASLAQVPESVTLTFSDPMSQKYAKVAVTGPGEQPVGRGAPQVDGKRVTIALDQRAPGGTYRVGYRVVSADGHPVSGSYTFTVRVPKASADPATSPTPGRSTSPVPERTPVAPAASESGGRTGRSTTAITAAGVLLAAGAAAYFMVRRRRVGRGE
ncbi:copper resistance CopC family protein [Streptomyces cyaneofuscatus]|uniref:copper resistance CopC family protein n=1 Tax=Streptomyces cyaneofuscatus TaxID=66883 RepID=UPI0038118017